MKINFELNFENIILYIACILTICSILGILYLFLGLIDQNKDIKSCEIGMKSTTENNVNCFANEDYFKVNFGKDVGCTCFYWEGINFKQKKFQT